MMSGSSKEEFMCTCMRKKAVMRGLRPRATDSHVVRSRKKSAKKSNQRMA